LEQLYNFLDIINKNEYLKTYRRSSKREQFENEINDVFDKLVVSMQDDIGFEKLDSGLKYRTGGKRRAVEAK